MPDFSDFIVFVDESGDHGLTTIDPEFPVFALAFCVMRKSDYLGQVVPALQQLKFDFWGHDGIVLHEHELRKSEGPFGILRRSRALREDFMARLSGIVENAPFDIYASVIDKIALRKRYVDPWNPYEIALRFCMERVLAAMRREGQDGRILHVQFESRGPKEDRELELEFRRICDNQGQWGYIAPNFQRMQFEPHFLPKSTNSIGLQLADLVARPIALNAIRPRQANRAFDTILPKLKQKKVFP